MKKIALMTLMILVVVSVFAFATGIPIYKFVTPTGWTEETNPNIADATATGSWNTGGYVILPAAPNYYHVPKINWNVEISQWMYISMQYLNYQMHVDAPGDYTVDSFTIHAISNGGVYVYMRTGGPLTNVDDTSQTIPTWLGYKVDASTGPSVGLPSNGNNNGFWYDMNWINNNHGSPSQKFTIYQGGAWEHSFDGWLGFRVDYTTAKADYTTWLDIYIQSDP